MQHFVSALQSGGNFAKVLVFELRKYRFTRKIYRRKSSIFSFKVLKVEEVSHELLVLEACRLKFGGSLARNARFHVASLVMLAFRGVAESRVARVAVLQFSRSLRWFIRVRGFCLVFNFVFFPRAKRFYLRFLCWRTGFLASIWDEKTSLHEVSLFKSLGSQGSVLFVWSSRRGEPFCVFRFCSKANKFYLRPFI